MPSALAFNSSAGVTNTHVVTNIGMAIASYVLLEKPNQRPLLLAGGAVEFKRRAGQPWMTVRVRLPATPLMPRCQLQGRTSGPDSLDAGPLSLVAMFCNRSML